MVDEPERDDEWDRAEEPSVASLIVRGILVIVLAFVAAIWILIAHSSVGH